MTSSRYVVFIIFLLFSKRSKKNFWLSFVHSQAMSKFYTACTQAKELCIEAKDAKEKNKELSNEVLLKKGEVIRLIEDFKRGWKMR